VIAKLRLDAVMPYCWKCEAALLMPDVEGPFLSVDGDRTRLEGCREEYRIHSYEEARGLCPLLDEQQETTL
jgi:hypothetical protein